MSAQLTYQDVAEHNTKKDLYIVIHDKVYDVTKFVNEHPGGEEVLLDVGGQDATEAFEDVGHSDEAREALVPLLVGTLKRKPGDPKPNLKAHGHGAVSPAAQTGTATGLGVGLYAIIVLGGAAAFFAYQYLQAQQAAAAPSA
ncbi:cytochrome b5-like heme/steroid binding domain-containing protein [Pseudoneurospora amorphoporcata]|uniref:Cytochrome b5-like heme/steroid binding domain-containing protein n=1 Tax=Pseudoneurospora amorphoporcata TaxID=241081 RepID=A0AAN6P3R4_9PEZI|nr:cytochrome b5-like heme/steroid binding domain-containing protein [Pseudoneurospora amorphoporcata]